MEFLIAGGGGALIGGIIIKIIELLAGRGKANADSAKALTDAATTFTAGVTQLNINLHKELILLKRAIITLTDTVDEILPYIEGLTPEQRKRLMDATIAAKLAI